MSPRPPTSTRPDTLFPYPPLFRSRSADGGAIGATSPPLHHSPSAIGPPPHAFGTGRICHHFARTFFPIASSRSEEHTSELQSLIRISYAVFCLKKQTNCQHKRTQSPINQQSYKTQNDMDQLI